MERVEEMKCIESNANSLGVPAAILMENAGTAVSDAVAHLSRGKGKVLVLCGPGRNGGDGLVAARQLLKRGRQVTVSLLVSPGSLKSTEARSNWEQYLQLNGPNVHAGQEDWVKKTKLEIRACKLMVDAIYGTGIRGEIVGDVAEIIDEMNASRKPVIAVDTPSGLEPFSGTVASKTVRATITVTFHALKHGLVLRRDLAGKIQVASIGIPESASLFVASRDVADALPARGRFTHKGDYGTVVVVGGSELYSGAPALAALAALRTGAGLVYVACPDKVAISIRSMSPDLIVRSLPGDRITYGHVDALERELGRASVLALGPGLGTAEDSVGGAREIAQRALAQGKRLVIDADALRICESLSDGSSPRSVVATPHAGEFKKIAGVDVGTHWAERVDPVREFAKSHKCAVLLKGYYTVISDGSSVKVNQGGNPGMSKGGTGDVLTGVLAGLLAQGSAMMAAACGAAHICGEAADLLFTSKGFHYTATDLLLALPEVLREYDRYAD